LGIWLDLAKRLGLLENVWCRLKPPRFPGDVQLLAEPVSGLVILPMALEHPRISFGDKTAHSMCGSWCPRILSLEEGQTSGQAGRLAEEVMKEFPGGLPHPQEISPWKSNNQKEIRG
jgi:hypothetical protein